MRDAADGRLWAEHHDAFSEDLGRRLDKAAARFAGSSGDPLPLVAKAMALVLAVSLTSLSFSLALV